MDGVNFNTVVEAVKTLGFPIIMCLWFMRQSMKRDDRQTKALEDISKVMKELSDTTVAQITKVVEKEFDELQAAERANSNVARLPLPLLPPPIEKEGVGK